MPPLPARIDRDQTLGEEIANSVSHGLALLASIVGIPFLILHAVHAGTTAYLVGTCVFSASILLLYSGSTVYHALKPGKAKRVFRTLEHSAIYLLIAGTYTPFTLGVLHGAWGWSLLGVIWAMALAGVLLKSFGRKPHPILSTVLYVAMGWVIVVAIEPMFERMPTAGLAWLLAGGLSYTAGVAFFATDSRLKFGHLVWHLFVTAGTVCHFFAVLRYAQ